MAERIFIGVAWPYANGSLHLGHIAGCYLPSDIFARYHRLKGNEVLMVSGSDQHGTPITIKAEQEGISPQEVVDRYHKEFLGCWERLGITFDLFTNTETDNHIATAQEMFLTLLDKGYIYKDTMALPYCDTCKRFLPDRYVEGTCPHCGNPNARGDQCEECGKTLDPKDLLNLRCRISGDTPEIKDSEHFFLKLSAFRDQLLSWVQVQSHWRPNVLNFTRRYLEDGLKDRAITRDIQWGVPIPLEGYEGKRIYVWFEAVIGYLSAAKEWAQRNGRPDQWQDFWQKDCKAYYFLGKDNIPFHTLIWPGMLMGYGGLNLPYDIPANEFLNMEGRQLSTSRNWAVWLPDYLERYDPDPLRYYLSANMPETSDSDFSWKDFLRRNNDELVATFGNLVHRTLTFTYRQFDGKVPQPGPIEPPSDHDQLLNNRATVTLKEVGDHIARCNFRLALASAMSLAQAVNRYLDFQAPWKTIKDNPSQAATSLWTALSVINCLKTAFYPFLPFSSQKLHTLLGFTGSLKDQGWKWHPQALPPGQTLPEPKALFTKLDEEVVEVETQRMGR